MRVRRASSAATSELGRLLGPGRTRPGGGPLIEVSSLADGVVAFEREEDAAAFAERLSSSPSSPSSSSSGSSGSSTSAVGAASSHELFRATGDAKAVVVLVRRPRQEEEEEEEEGGDGHRRLLRDNGRSQNAPLLGPLPDPSALAAALKAGKQGELEP